MIVLRSALFAIVFYFGSVFVVAAAGVSPLFGQDAVIAAARRWARWHRWCAKVLLGLETRFEGPLPQGSYLFAIKHESMFETIETLVWFEKPAVVFKRELLDIPVWGAVAKRHGVIPVDRDSGATAVRQMVTAGKAAIAQGRPVILFPEGTRVPHGDSPPLRAGMAGLYRLLGLPIVPLALDSGRYSPRGSFLKRSGVVRVRVGEIIPPGLPREEVEARVHAAINALNGS